MNKLSVKLLFSMTACLVLSGCAFVNFDFGSFTQMQPFEERVLKPGSKDKILVVEVLGLIRTTGNREGFRPRQGTFERLESVLEKAKDDKAIKGVILKIDSPGGGYTASDLIYRKVKEFKSKKTLPVVACIVDQGTSGGYMVALASDYIIAIPSSVVGNVGVLMPSISLGGLMNKVGVAEQTIKSGKLKDAGSPLHDMSPEEKELLSNIVTEFAKNFIGLVKTTRPVTESDLAVIQDGRVLTATMGKQLHLIDDIGYYEDALKKVETLSNVQEPTVVVYRRKGENRGGFYSWP